MALILIPSVRQFTLPDRYQMALVLEARYNIIELLPFVNIPCYNIFGAVLSGASSVCLQILTADVQHAAHSAEVDSLSSIYIKHEPLNFNNTDITFLPKRYKAVSVYVYIKSVTIKHLVLFNHHAIQITRLKN